MNKSSRPSLPGIMKRSHAVARLGEIVSAAISALVICIAAAAAQSSDPAILWVKRAGSWVETLSYQSTIQAAPAAGQ